jgi:hypothetical protein
MPAGSREALAAGVFGGAGGSGRSSERGACAAASAYSGVPPDMS